MRQTTLGRSISYKGIGLHSGQPVQMVMKPAAPDTGIVFRRTDLPEPNTVPAHVDFVTETMRATTLQSGTVMVVTVEHVLSALQAMGIDNCEIELDSLEPPVGDGSAAVFVDLIDQAGRVEQEAEKRYLYVKHSTAVYDKAGDRFVTALPYDGLRVTFISENPHPLLGTMVVDIDVTKESYREQIMRARTIGFVHELEKMRAMGLAKGGNTENAIVYSADECLSELRYPDELVRHKILDVIGDISLAGQVRGHIIARKSSHALNVQLARQLAAQMKEDV